MALHNASNTSSTVTPNAAYSLRTLLDDIPLKEDPESDQDVYITTVDTWDGNLYVGTSAAELLHFVSIPPEDSAEEPTWILASRQQPPFTTEQEGLEKGVRQILILPNAGKACVLCNATLTFYTLPELSPAYERANGGRIKQAGCTWIGGLDLSAQSQQVRDPVIAICLRQRLRLIRIGDDAVKLRDIELGGVSAIQRRGDLACVADGVSYSLLDVVNQRKNELFSITTSATSSEPHRTQELAQSHPVRQQSRSFSTANPIRLNRGHERNTSLGSVERNTGRLHPSNPPWPGRTSSTRTSQESSPVRDVSASSSPPRPPDKDDPPQRLPPNIVSPSANEFLLTTGTKYDEPGVGIFVNLDGDVVRGTIEFSSYPDMLLLDGNDQDGADQASQPNTEPFVLALVRTEIEGVLRSMLELQIVHADPSEVLRSKQRIQLPVASRPLVAGQPLLGTGIRTATSRTSLNTSEISKTLRQRRLLLDNASSHKPDNVELKRNEEEDKFVARFSAVSSQILVFSGSRVSWAVKASTVVRLSQDLALAIISSDTGLTIDATKVQYVLNSIRGQQATNELEFVTLTYIRQRGSLLLFGHLLVQTMLGISVSSQQRQAVILALEEGDLDPRVLLSLLPVVKDEVSIGSRGLWLPQGLLDTIATLNEKLGGSLAEAGDIATRSDVSQCIKAYLLIWRKKKGFGSVVDEAAVFRSVDAALVHLLLILDQDTPRGPAIPGSIRAELNEIVDKGVDCFDRAVELFEQFGRLYMLSRLYQSRKMSSQVLACWKRILDGEHDTGGELVDGYTETRKYLARLRDKSLVTEYGAWLASRDAGLGAQIFADETARVTFTPTEAVEILKQRAPSAVKDFLEYLVFGKNHVQYVNDLISYYLSTILSELKNPTSEAKSTLLQSTETYRALRPPKPTFKDFITDNAVPAEWWANRLRLLQLIGGSHGAASRYDVHVLREQLEPYSNALVPEMIILNGREGKHEEAIHLLVAGLGDYDTAVRYCLLGGSSIFHPTSSTAAQRPPIPSAEEQSRLFQHLLHEFMTIDDPLEQLERTSELLDRFGGWFDVSEVLSALPTTWTVDVVSGFLVSAFRRLLQEKNETGVAKALASAQNLRTSATMIEKLEGLPPQIVTEQISLT